MVLHTCTLFMQNWEGGENIRSWENALLGADIGYDGMKNKISIATFTLTQYRLLA